MFSYCRDAVRCCLFVTVCTTAALDLHKHHPSFSSATLTMDTSWPSNVLLCDLTEESYERTFSAYRFWIEIGATHGGISNHQLHNDILGVASTMSNLITRPCQTNPQVVYNSVLQLGITGQLILPNIHLLLRFITDVELDSALSTYAVGLHDRLCRESLEQFFRQTLDYVPGGADSWPSREFYTRVNLIAHWVNLGYVKLEDIRDRILQSLIFQPTVHPYQLNSLMILLKISGATFAAHVDPSVIDRCCDLLKPSNLSRKLVLFDLAEVRTPILSIEMIYEC